MSIVRHDMPRVSFVHLPDSIRRLIALRDLLISRYRGVGIFLPFCGIESRFFLRLGHRRLPTWRRARRPSPLPLAAPSSPSRPSLCLLPRYSNTGIAKRAAPPARSQCGCGAMRSVTFGCLPEVLFLFWLFRGYPPSISGGLYPASLCPLCGMTCREFPSSICRDFIWRLIAPSRSPHLEMSKSRCLSSFLRD